MADLFTYDASTGETISLKPFTTIPAGVFRRARNLDALGQVFACIEAAADEENLDKVDALPVAELNDLFDKWADGADVPKS